MDPRVDTTDPGDSTEGLKLNEISVSIIFTESLEINELSQSVISSLSRSSVPSAFKAYFSCDDDDHCDDNDGDNCAINDDDEYNDRADCSLDKLSIDDDIGDDDADNEESLDPSTFIIQTVSSEFRLYFIVSTLDCDVIEPGLCSSLGFTAW